MSTDRDPVEIFRRTYERLLERAPVSDADWPPALTAREAAPRPAPRGWMVAAIVFLVTVAFGLGWSLSPVQLPAAADPFQIQPATSVPAVPDTSGVTYSSPADAAIAYARAQEPGIDDPQVTRIIGIYADERIVDLRVQVQTSDFCHWYGVTGAVLENDELAWSGGQAGPCDGR